MTKTPTTKKTRKVTSIPELPINPFVFEVFEAASKQRTAAKKVEVLKKYEHDSVKAMAIWNFDKTVVSLLPEGPVPYGETNAQTTFAGTLSDNLAREAQGGESATGQDLDGRNKTSIRNEYVNFYNFIKGGRDSNHQQLREAYGHIPNPQARKIMNYLAGILEDAVRYSNDRRPGRRKKGSK